jgi:hypothetical protein
VSTVTGAVRVPIGVLVERRKANSPWSEFVWRPTAVLGGIPEADPWTQLAIETVATTFYAGASHIELYRSETKNYRDNLLSDTPSVWVELFRTESDRPYEIGVVTADPAEGESLVAGHGIVEAVPMPGSVRDIVASFVATHHVERAFEKRRRDRADPEARARRTPRRENGTALDR